LKNSIRSPFLAAYLVAVCLLSPVTAEERPNFVWIVSEDNSIHYLDHFFPGGADTPNIKALAEHGLTFDHAFSNASVCSVARSTLATMCMTPRIGAQYHRRYVKATLPAGQPTFYQAIQSHGYFTTNHTKEDFNFTSQLRGRFDKGRDWRGREHGQPFFHMESLKQSHESSLHFPQSEFDGKTSVHNPTDIQLADYHPDTPMFRYTHARYLDIMLIIDDSVGAIVEKLKADGLLEDTFIFYFGDHGGVLPRGKGYAYESGLHVPLVVRVPANFRHLAGC